MKRLKLIISDEAVSDLVDLWTYIAEDSPERADQFVDQIHEKCKTLAETPMMGRERTELLLLAARASSTPNDLLPRPSQVLRTGIVGKTMKWDQWEQRGAKKKAFQWPFSFFFAPLSFRRRWPGALKLSDWQKAGPRMLEIIESEVR